MGGFDPIGIQAQTWSLSRWLPLSAAASKIRSAYGLRSAYCPGLILTWHGFDRIIDDSVYDFAFCRKMLQEYLALRPFFYGDYYPLAPYSLNAQEWLAWAVRQAGPASRHCPGLPPAGLCEGQPDVPAGRIGAGSQL